MHRGGGILALDCARILGWAAADREAVAAWPDVLALDGAVGPFRGLKYGRKILVPPGQRAGNQFAAFEIWLEQAISLYRPQVIVGEEPLLIGGGDGKKFKTSMDAQRRGIAMWGVWNLVAAQHGIAAHSGAHQSSIKKHFTGQGSSKAPVMDVCRRRGWDPEDDNAADALAALDWTIHDLRRLVCG